MAVDPHAANLPPKRYIPNTIRPLLRLSPTAAESHLLSSAAHIISNCPPTLPWSGTYSGAIHRGLFRGPTSLSFFFFALSIQHPTLQISGRLPIEWSKAYLSLSPLDSLPLLSESCGISNEFLASNALRACIYQDSKFVEKVLDALRLMDVDPTACEWLKGRAGALYFLRFMRTHFSSLTKEIDIVVTSLIEDMSPQEPWVWGGKQYLGLVHGEIGIVTQIVLSDPSYAPKLEGKLEWLLELQGEEGNWPVVEGKDIGLVQFCHGAPGFVISLLAIREYFPTLKKEIVQAIENGRNIIWEKGLLTKEPNICHGILGNALALEGEQREHFLCLATPEMVGKGLADGSFERNLETFGLLWGEAGVAWVWMNALSGGKEGSCVLYTDV